MGDWQVFADKTRELLKSKKLTEAKEEVAAGLKKLLNQINLLTIATYVFRASNDRKKSLKYAELLITHHPENIDGYRLAAEDLIAIGRIIDADKLAEGMVQKFPGRLDALEIAIIIFKETSNSARLLECQERIVEFHPCVKDLVESSLKTLSNGAKELNQIRKLISPHTPIIPGRSGVFCNSLIQFIPENTKQRLWIKSFQIESVAIECIKDCADYQPFQYWSQGTPPPDVNALTLMWNELLNDLGIRPIKMFSKSDARDFIAEHTPQLLTAFDSAFHYTIESDIFRIAFALFNDCIYLDADCFPKRQTRLLIKSLLREKTTSLCFRWFSPWICGGFFVTCAQSPFFRKIVEETSGYTFKDKPRTRKEVFDSFGPARLNASLQFFLEDTVVINGLKNSDELKINEGWRIKFANCHNAFSEGHFSLEYKKTNDNWWQQFSN